MKDAALAKQALPLAPLNHQQTWPLTLVRALEDLHLPEMKLPSADELISAANKRRLCIRRWQLAYTMIHNPTLINMRANRLATYDLTIPEAGESFFVSRGKDFMERTGSVAQGLDQVLLSFQHQQRQSHRLLQSSSASAKGQGPPQPQNPPQRPPQRPPQSPPHSKPQSQPQSQSNPQRHGHD